MNALYNEWEPYPAAWMRNLIAAGHLAPGRVDERSIAELAPTDLVGVVQFHAFAGLGGWGCALRRAGWSDDREVWTLSCPCQGLSVAGLQRGADDDRHLWPVIYRLIAECRPPVLFGEQVAGAAGIAWLTAVRADLEDLGYAVGAADLAAAGVGAPHIRQRMFFGAVRVSDADGERRDGIGLRILGRGSRQDRAQARGRGETDRMADGDGAGLAGRPVHGGSGGSGSAAERGGGGGARDMEHADSGGYWAERINGDGRTMGHRRSGADVSPAAQDTGVPRGLPDAESIRRCEGCVPRGSAGRCGAGSADGGGMGDADREHAGRNSGPAPRAEAPSSGWGGVDRAVGHEPRASGRVRDPWDDAVWLDCRDGKRRPAPAQPGLHPLAHGVSGRVGQLRAAGNAIVVEAAAEFIRAFDEALTDTARAA